MTPRLTAGFLIALALTSSGASADIRTVALTGDPAPGGTPEATFETVRLVGLNNAGQTAFIGSDTDGNGIWSESSGVLDSVVHIGDPAPWNDDGEFNFSRGFAPVTFHDAGTAFMGGVRDTDDETLVGIWSKRNPGLELVAGTGNVAPGTADGVTFVRPASSSLAHNGVGNTAFVSYITGPDVDGSNNVGIWSEGSGVLQLVTRLGQPAPGTKADITFDRVGFGSELALNNVGDVAIHGIVTGPGVDETNESGIWLHRDGTLELVARSGDQVPGMAVGVRFAYLNTDPVINDAGQTAFFGGMTDVDGTLHGGIWSNGTGEFKLAVRIGDPTPGVPEATFESMLVPSHVLNGSGQIAFPARAEVAEDEHFWGIWSEGSGTLDLVARTGVAAPGTEVGVEFLTFRVGEIGPRYGVPHLNGAGQTAFAAKLVGPGVNLRNENGIWAESISGELMLIAREGDLLEVRPGEFRTISELLFADGSGNQDDRNSLFNERGQLAFGATFTDGSSGVFVSNAVAVPELASWALLLAGAVLLIGRRSRF